ncbi:hypothetical protein ACFE04_003865 [Oxalis oulophora]
MAPKRKSSSMEKKRQMKKKRLMKNPNQTQKTHHTPPLSIDVICIILSFLKITDQVCASLVSTSWKLAYDSLCIRNFDQALFENRLGKSCRTSFNLFKELVERDIKKIHAQQIYLNMFRLNMVRYNERMSTLIDNWINMLPKNNMEVLELILEDCGYGQNCVRGGKYELPLSCLAVKALKILKLKGCNLTESSFGKMIEFGNLKTLSLIDVSISDSLLQKIFGCCQQIRNLRLIQCCGVMNLPIISLPCLESVTVVQNSNWNKRIRRIEVNSSTLRSFYYEGETLNIADLTCPNLVDLTLKVREGSRRSEPITFHVPNLINLDLDFPISFHVIEILSTKLRTLKIRKKGRSIIFINSPNLEALEISLSSSQGNIDLLRSLVKIKAPKFQKVKIEIEHYGEINTSWFLNLCRFLQQLVHELILKLIIHCPKVKWNPIDTPMTTAALPVAIKQVKLEFMNKTLNNYGEFLEGLFSICHPESLSLLPSEKLTNDEKILKTLCEKVLKTDENPVPNCCSSSKNKCWRHYMQACQIKQVNDGKIIDSECFLRGLSRSNGKKARFSEGSSSECTELENLENIDFQFQWIK